MRIVTKPKKNRVTASANLNIDALESEFEAYIGQPATKAKRRLESMGFECTLIAGPDNTTETWEEWESADGSTLVKLYFILNRSGNKLTNGVLTDVYVDSYVGASTKTIVASDDSDEILEDIEDAEFALENIETTLEDIQEAVLGIHDALDSRDSAEWFKSPSDARKFTEQCDKADKNLYKAWELIVQICDSVQ